MKEPADHYEYNYYIMLFAKEKGTIQISPLQWNGWANTVSLRSAN